MQRLRILVAVAMLASAVLWAAPVQAVRPASFDCGASANAYPGRWSAEGATFQGRVLSVRKLAPDFRVVRFEVGRVHAGDIGGRVRVRTKCVATRFHVGERYLVSSSLYEPKDGRVESITFVSLRSVGWRIDDDGPISLLGYGPGLGQPPEPYLTEPDTVWEAAHAVAYGIQNEGTCVGGEDNIPASWHMEVDRSLDDGGLEFVVAFDVRPARSWTVNLFQNYQRFFHKASVREGDFEIVRLRPDTAGPDRFGFRARQADGQVCRGAVTY